MARMIELADGSKHILMGEQDILSLVDAYMGYEARKEVEELLAEQDLNADYIEDLEKELKAAREKHSSVMETLREESEVIADLIREKDIDRRALSAAAGRIGTITRRELHV